MNKVGSVSGVDSNDKAAKFISSLYRNHQGYFDQHMHSVILFILLTIAITSTAVYSHVVLKRDEIAQNWATERCRPAYLPFAGYIHNPTDKSNFEYTGENFQYCVQNILVNITGTALQPIQYLLSALSGDNAQMGSALNSIRGMTATIRDNVTNFTQGVMQRILSIIIPFQRIFIALIDTMNKTQGILATGLYTSLGTYYTLQSLMGAILEMIVKILSALLIVIIGLWAAPVTWPAAVSSSAIFTAIAVPLGVIAIFMNQMLGVSASPIPKLRCFDGNTSVPLWCPSSSSGEFHDIDTAVPATATTSFTHLPAHLFNADNQADDQAGEREESEGSDESTSPLHDMPISANSHSHQHLSTSFESLGTTSAVSSSSSVSTTDSSHHSLESLDKNLIQPFKCMRDLKCGDRLADGGYVTAVMQIDAQGLDMYEFPFGKISGTHLLYSGWGKYMRCAEVAKAEARFGVAEEDRKFRLSDEAGKYAERLVYCCNTTTKHIVMGDYVFTDWDEFLTRQEQKWGKRLKRTYAARTEVCVRHPANDSLVWMPMCTVEVGTVIAGGGVVYGKVADIQGRYSLLVTTARMKIRKRKVVGGNREVYGREKWVDDYDVTFVEGR